MSNFEPEPYQGRFRIKGLDPWSTIETYYRMNPNYKSKIKWIHLMNLFIAKRMV